MKLKVYRLLFRIFSALSNKTNGTPWVVKCKLLLGTVIIGLVSVSCEQEEIDRNRPTCYLVLEGRANVTDSINMDALKAKEPEILCYESVMPYTLEDESEIEKEHAKVEEQPSADSK